MACSLIVAHSYPVIKKIPLNTNYYSNNMRVCVLLLDKGAKDEKVDDEKVVIVDGPDSLASKNKDHVSSWVNHEFLVIVTIILGVVLLAALAIVAVLAFIVAKKRQLRKSGYVRVQVSSETEATNNTLEEIKKDGYVNPTYKFYTRH